MRQHKKSGGLMRSGIMSVRLTCRQTTFCPKSWVPLSTIWAVGLRPCPPSAMVAHWSRVFAAIEGGTAPKTRQSWPGPRALAHWMLGDCHMAPATGQQPLWRTTKRFGSPRMRAISRN
jgi:hypothetical protein